MAIIGAIWKKKDKNDKTYLSIAIENPTNPEEKWNVAAFINGKKSKPNHSDFYIVHNDDKDGNGYSRKPKDENAEEDDEF